MVVALERPYVLVEFDYPCPNCGINLTGTLQDFIDEKSYECPGCEYHIHLDLLSMSMHE